MAQKIIRRGSRSICLVGRFCLAALIVITFLLSGGYAAEKPKQTTFPSPEAAAEGLLKAVREYNEKELVAILGPGSEPLVSTGDPVDDRQNWDEFLKSYEGKNRLESAGKGKVTLYIGKDDWPFPIPIVQSGKSWRFDTRAGKDEILNRIIGENELSAIQVLLAIADAQREYSDGIRERTGKPEYAQRLESTPGKKDGLYWEAAPGEEQSPLGPLAAGARAEGYSQSPGLPTPFHGYYYKILTAQGKNASDGAYDYVVNGKMVGGFAILAYPASYCASGIYSFIVNHDGVVYRKNLGKNTAKIATAMTKFDPDRTWKKIQ